MPELTPLAALTVFVFVLIAGAGWTLGSAIMAALLGAIRRGT